MLATLNVIGNQHTTCQDSLFTRQRGPVIMGGVFDGCSTGIKSAWASQTFAYVFSGMTNILSDNSIMQAYHELKVIKNRLDLYPANFLTTCLLFEYNTEKKELATRAFGDGFYYVNQVEYEIDQKNTSDYFGYYLDDLKSFSEYLDKYPVKTYYDVTNFKVYSDGIKSIGISQFVDQDGTNPLQVLLSNPTSKNYLERMWNILKRKKFTISDDLTIISYVQD